MDTIKINYSQKVKEKFKNLDLPKTIKQKEPIEHDYTNLPSIIRNGEVYAFVCKFANIGGTETTIIDVIDFDEIRKYKPPSSVICFYMYLADSFFKE